MNSVEKCFQGLIACRNYRRTWAFPREVSELLQRETAGRSVLHLYAGMAKFGTRLDADPAVRPDVIGNALFPPFGCESFDVVIVDPPYQSNYNMPAMVLLPAACIAREKVWWFHTHYQPHVCRLIPSRWWAVLPSKKGPLRVLIEYSRRRHPRACNLPADWRAGVELKPFNWSRHLNQRPLVLS